MKMQMQEENHKKQVLLWLTVKIFPKKIHLLFLFSGKGTVIITSKHKLAVIQHF